ncbi:kappa-type opioid receptor-like [Glandiceps talaboti]
MQSYVVNRNTSLESNTTEHCEYPNNYGIHCEAESKLPSCISDSNTQYIAGLSICSLGIVGNLAFMFVVLRVAYMRTATNAYLVNLAVADLLHLSTHWFTWICALRDQSMFHTSVPLLCVDVFLSRITQYVSLFTVTVLSVERYMAFCKPVMYREGIIHKRSRIVQVIVFTWSLAILLSLEMFTACLRMDLDGRRLPEVIFESIYVVVAICLMCVVISVYSIIIRQVRRVHNNGSSGSIRTHEHQIMRVCLTTALAYFIFTLPPVVLMITYLLWRYDGVNISQDVIICLANLGTFSLEINSSVNLIIYNAVSSRYRKAFRDAFTMDIRLLRHCTLKLRNARNPRVMKNSSTNIEREMTPFSSTEHSPPCVVTSVTNF